MVAIKRKLGWISRGHGRIVACVWALLAWASPLVAAVGSRTAVEPQEVSDKAQRLVLLVGVTTLLLAFLFVGVILIRALRHVRQQALRTAASPTDASDVWAMHRLPEDPESTEDRDDDTGDAH